MKPWPTKEDFEFKWPEYAGATHDFRGYERARYEAAMERLRLALQWARHDYECQMHVLQWRRNEKEGRKRHGEKCDCGLDEALATIGELPDVREG